MYYFDGVIVVEGKGDVSFLSSFIQSEYVILNGFDMPDDTLDYLRNIKNRKIIVMTDPDEAGIAIEKRLRNKEIEYEYKKIDINKCNKNRKHGVAECDMEEIIKVLSSELKTAENHEESISKASFFDLGLSESKELREKVSRKLHLGTCNAKTLYKRMNYNGISKEDIIELWK